MGITHVLRGEDLLSSTPAPDRAVRGAGSSSACRAASREFGHLPFVMGEGNKKLSKRDPQSTCSATTASTGFLPEGLLNYLALLGWSHGRRPGDLQPQELVGGVRRATRITVNPARFDLKKCEAINAVHLRRSTPRTWPSGSCPFLADAGLLPGGAPGRPPRERRRMADAPRRHPAGPGADGVLSEALGMLGFLFTPRTLRRRARRRRQVPRPGGQPVLEAASEALSRLTDWTTPRSRRPCGPRSSTASVSSPRSRSPAIRVAVTGRRVSPPLFESIELLGRDRTLARLRSAAQTIA